MIYRGWSHRLRTVTLGLDQTFGLPWFSIRNSGKGSPRRGGWWKRMAVR